MELIPARSWKHEFARSTEAERYREIVRRHQDELRRKKDKNEKDREERSETLDGMVMVAVATQADVDAYLVTTAHYQEATYEAIIENQQLLLAVRREREELFEKAYVLPDGRRVFESEDGIRVFDEHGQELDPSVISADEIEDWRPKHEEVLALAEREAILMDEQSDLHEYLQTVDEARERLEAGDISQSDFDALKKDLADSMPDRVLANLPEEHRPERELKVEEQAALAVDATPVARAGSIPGMGN